MLIHLRTQLTNLGKSQVKAHTHKSSKESMFDVCTHDCKPR